jgi:hypothetical protein
MAQQLLDPENTMMVVALKPRFYEYLGEIFSRAMANGLIAPDELTEAHAVWGAYRRAQAVPLDRPDAPLAPLVPPADTEPQGDSDGHT